MRSCGTRAGHSFALITLGALAAGLQGCDWGTDTAEVPAVVVEVVQAEQRDFPLDIELVGSLLGNQDVPIRARVDGFLESINFVEGQDVGKGQLLYTIDPQPFQQKLVEAQSQLAAAETGLAKADADLQRIRPLAEMSAVSQQDLDSAVAQEAAARAAVEAAKAQVELARIELGYTEIYAPIDGLIGLTKAKPGEYVGREPNPVVLNTLSDIDPIRVRFSISEREYLILARNYLQQDANMPGYRGAAGAGETAEARSARKTEAVNQNRELVLILADGTEWAEPGYADATSQAIDPATGTFTVEASFPNPNGLLRPGQFARVRALYQTLEDAIVVPMQAVVEIQGLFQVYVVNADNVVEVVNVEIGPARGNEQVIKSGLRPGQTVIVEGVQKVREGMTVTAQPFSAGAAQKPLRQT